MADRHHMPDTDQSNKCKDAQSLRRLFSDIAHRYDFLNRFLSAGTDTRWRRFAARKGSDAETRKVLDVCCGTADLAIAYADVVEEATIVGCDFSSEMLRIGRKKLVKKQMDHRVTLLDADALAMPFASDTFDVAAVAFGIRNVSNLENGISEMTRVVRPGGRVVIVEFGMPRGRIIGPLYSFYFRKILPVMGGLISGRGYAYTYLPMSVAEFATPEQLKATMEKCGLQHIEIWPLSYGIANVHIGYKNTKD